MLTFTLQFFFVNQHYFKSFSARIGTPHRRGVRDEDDAQVDRDGDPDPRGARHNGFAALRLADLAAVRVSGEANRIYPVCCDRGKSDGSWAGQMCAKKVVSLFFFSQDQECLYLVMEYLPGGDLLSLMIRTGVFDEELASFIWLS